MPGKLNYNQHNQDIEELRMPFITLMTDFGIQDGAMCAMKGAIWGNCPKMQSYHIISNSVTGLGVKTDDVMEAHFSHA